MTNIYKQDVRDRVDVINDTKLCLDWIQNKVEHENSLDELSDLDLEYVSDMLRNIFFTIGERK